MVRGERMSMNVSRAFAMQEKRVVTYLSLARIDVQSIGGRFRASDADRVMPSALIAGTGAKIISWDPEPLCDTGLCWVSSELSGASSPAPISRMPPSPETEA